LNPIFLENIFKFYLMEDAYFSDLSTDSVTNNEIKTSIIMAKEDLILSGAIFIEPLFKIINEKFSVEYLHQDGDFVKKGEVIASVTTKDYCLLYLERICLNIMQRTSGISTKVHKIAKLIKDYNTKLVDTRKTTPGFRFFEKYAVKIGGGINHRMGLFDAVLLKDNHIKDSGGITNAVKKAKANAPFTAKIEVECSNYNMVKEAIENNVDIIMLDNMGINDMKDIIKEFKNRAIFEASGNIDESNIVEVAKTGVDYVSMGSLTHHACWVDINMKME